MTKAELIDRVADRTGFTKKDSGKAIDALFETITSSLMAGEKVSLVGFGTFDVRARDERVGRNPQTGDVIRIPARRVPVFKAGKPLKDAVSR